MKLIKGAIRQFPVPGIFADIEKNIAVRLVSELLLDQRFDEGDDVAHRFGSFRHLVDLIDAHASQVAEIVGRVFFGDLRHRNAAFFDLKISLSSTSVMFTTSVTS